MMKKTANYNLRIEAGYLTDSACSNLITFRKILVSAAFSFSVVCGL